MGVVSVEVLQASPIYYLLMIVFFFFNASEHECREVQMYNPFWQTMKRCRGKPLTSKSQDFFQQQHPYCLGNEYLQYHSCINTFKHKDIYGIALFYCLK